MKLFIKDRIYFPQLLPKENTYMDFNIKKSILAKVALTPDDADKYKIREDTQKKQVEWDSKVDAECPLEVSFTADELAYLRRGCEALSDSAFPDDFWGVVEKVYAEN